MITINPKINDTDVKNLNKLKLSIPNCLNVKISRFSKISIKKNCVDIRKIKRNISYSNDGAFNEDNIKGVIKLASLFFKKFASSIKLIIKINIKNIPETKKSFFKNFFNRYCLCILIIKLTSLFKF